MKTETDRITSPAGDATKPPTILQVLPSLETGGVERGTIDIAGALKDAGWRPLVASSGGTMAHELERIGADHFEMPLHSKNPLVMRRNIARLRTLIESEGVDIVHARSRAPGSRRGQAGCHATATATGGRAYDAASRIVIFNFGERGVAFFLERAGGPVPRERRVLDEHGEIAGFR